MSGTTPRHSDAVMGDTTETEDNVQPRAPAENSSALYRMSVESESLYNRVSLGGGGPLRKGIRKLLRSYGVQLWVPPYAHDDGSPDYDALADLAVQFSLELDSEDIDGILECMEHIQISAVMRRMEQEHGDMSHLDGTSGILYPQALEDAHHHLMEQDNQEKNSYRDNDTDIIPPPPPAEAPPPPPAEAPPPPPPLSPPTSPMTIHQSATLQLSGSSNESVVDDTHAPGSHTRSADDAGHSHTPAQGLLSSQNEETEEIEESPTPEKGPMGSNTKAKAPAWLALLGDIPSTAYSDLIPCHTRICCPCKSQRHRLLCAVWERVISYI